MASRKSSLNQYTVPDGVPGPLSRGEPRRLGAVEPGNTEPWTRREYNDTNRTGDLDRDRDGDQDNDDAGQDTVGMSRSANLQAYEDVAEGDAVRDDGTDTEVEEDAPSSGEATPREDTLEAAEASTGAVTPNERPSSRCSEEGGGRSTPKPDDGIIHEVCDLVLQQAFGIQLHDVALAGSVSAAYESVSYCLDELSRIVLNSGLSNSGIVISESTWGRKGSSAVPIWPAGGVADSVGAGGGNGGGQGNGGGSRKRSNGGHDGAGGDGSPGGGKRQKVLPTHQQPPDMHFSCPFRKRNPVRFNVRDFQSCAVQSFPDIPQLKRAMGTQKALDEHISVGRDQICDPQKVPSSADPEDGITSGIEEALNGRKADSKIDGWQSLWNRLFPGDAEIPKSDFVPPTELDEVYAEFNTDYWTRQLRQRIQGVSGPASNAESLLGVFNTHIDSVFEACRLKNGGTASSRRQLRLQTTRQMTGRRSSVRLAPGRQGSGRSDSSISSPVATPNSASMLGNLEKALMAEPQPQMPYSRPTSSHSDIGVNVVGGVMMSFMPSGNANASQGGGQYVTVPPPTQIHVGFGSQDQNTTTGTLGGQLGQRPRLLPADSGLALNTTFPDQRAADFSPVASFGPQNAYTNLNFGQSMPDLCLRPLPPGVHGVQAQAVRNEEMQQDVKLQHHNTPSLQFFQAAALLHVSLELFGWWFWLPRLRSGVTTCLQAGVGARGGTAWGFLQLARREDSE
ncbi:hypothetical protein C8A01DRAFT_47550 [Parachaetomium inaequale]|uniref:Uncharacterized protein n=1 Tax=Parachaetomium inaequale TaxID=2588326 RepID=A0AAN6PGQ4_9PEZI|nr:hypothetical protein C8A01DRAFT_47550 [Parachaetomium inaequale]